MRNPEQMLPRVNTAVRGENGMDAPRDAPLRDLLSKAGAASGSPTLLAEAQGLGPSSMAFSRPSVVTWIRSEAAGTHQCL